MSADTVRLDKIINRMCDLINDDFFKTADDVEWFRTNFPARLDSRLCEMKMNILIPEKQAENAKRN